MPETLLHYAGLKPGQHSWYYNRCREFVTVHPGEWLRLDLETHPEVRPSVDAGIATTEETPPCDTHILDDTTNAHREVNEYGKAFSSRATSRPRGRGRPNVYELSTAQLGIVVRSFAPWPDWQSELDGYMAISEARHNRRGASSSISLPMPFDMAFPVFHRLAELLYRHWLADARADIEKRVQSSWATGEYDSIRELRNIYKRRYPFPAKRKVIGGFLQAWRVWARPQAPSSRHLRRYRAALGTHASARALADELILDALSDRGQRILIGPSVFSLGAYAPERAAAPSLTTIGPSLSTVLVIRPSFEEHLQLIERVAPGRTGVA